MTALQVLSADAGDRLQPIVVRSAVFIVATTLLVQTAVAARAAAQTLTLDFGFDFTTSVVLCIAAVAACVVTGGLRAAAAIEVAQGVLVFAIALLLLAPAMVALGGWEQVQAAIDTLDPVWTDAFGGKSGIVAVAFAAGGFGVGLAMCGQPQALNRFMAARDEMTLRRARWASLAWIALSLAVVMIGGWAANILYAGLEHPEQALLAIANRLLPQWLSAMLVVGILAAIVFSVGSLLLVIASSLAVDLKTQRRPAFSAVDASLRGVRGHCGAGRRRLCAGRTLGSFAVRVHDARRRARSAHAGAPERQTHSPRIHARRDVVGVHTVVAVSCASRFPRGFSRTRTAVRRRAWHRADRRRTPPQS